MNKKSKLKINKYPIPKTCRFCGGNVHFVECAARESWPYEYKCESCSASVGCHKNTRIPLGSLANKELRSIRSETKAMLNRAIALIGCNRTWFYGYLAKQMGIELKECHIGWFDEDQCELVKNIISRRVG